MKSKHDLAITQSNYILQKRLEVISFFEKYGLQPTVDAFNVSKSTIYRWRKKLRDSRYRTTSLIPKSTRPKNTRRMIVDEKILTFIKNLREHNHRFGKAKIKILLDEYCEREKIPKISSSLVGKIIKRNNWFFDGRARIYHDPDSHYARIGMARRKKKRKRISARFKATYPGELVQIDSIVKFELGIRRYILTAIDLYSRFSFAFSYKSLSSKLALDFYQKLERVTPFEIKGVKTDNGLEFLGEFEQYLEKSGVRHYYSYPRTPQSNAYVERFNRTIQEEWIDPNIELIEDTTNFNRKLMEYLIFFNTVRPHQALSYLTPMGHLIKEQHFSQMSVTHTYAGGNNNELL